MPGTCAPWIRRHFPSHEVVAVTRASEPLVRIEQGGRFGVILCDVMMPELTGMELHARLRSVCPETADSIVFWTGGAVTKLARDFVASVGNECIQKPFTLRALQEVLNAKLGARGSAVSSEASR